MLLRWSPAEAEAVRRDALIEGRWVERAGQRRRRYYKLTRTGRQTLASQRGVWDTFFIALNRVARIRTA